MYWNSIDREISKHLLCTAGRYWYSQTCMIVKPCQSCMWKYNCIYLKIQCPTLKKKLPHKTAFAMFFWNIRVQQQCLCRTSCTCFYVSTWLWYGRGVEWHWRSKLTYGCCYYLVDKIKVRLVLFNYWVFVSAAPK